MSADWGFGCELILGRSGISGMMLFVYPCPRSPNGLHQHPPGVMHSGSASRVLQQLFSLRESPTTCGLFVENPPWAGKSLTRITPCVVTHVLALLGLLGRRRNVPENVFGAPSVKSTTTRTPDCTSGDTRRS